MTRKSLDDAIREEDRKQGVKVMRSLGISIRTIKALERNAVDLAKLCTWRCGSRKVLKRNLLLLDGMGLVRVDEVVRALNWRKGKIIWHRGTYPVLWK